MGEKWRQKMEIKNGNKKRKFQEQFETKKK